MDSGVPARPVGNALVKRRAGRNPMRYEFRVEGMMAETTLHAAFPELDGIFVADQTILFGQVTDDAHLYGLLARFQSLGLRVTELRRLPD